MGRTTSYQRNLTSGKAHFYRWNTFVCPKGVEAGKVVQSKVQSTVPNPWCDNRVSMGERRATAMREDMAS